MQQKAGTESYMLQRKAIVNPASKINEVITELNAFCPQTIAANGNELQADCDSFVGSTQGCNCVRQVICDPKRAYTINVSDCSASPQKTTLWDQSVVDVPAANQFPDTRLGDNPVTQICDPNTSTIEFGAFDPNGDAVLADAPRVLAHEICGHGLFRTGPGVPTGNRPSHDSTIDIENSIAAEMGQPARGHFSDRHQGESFFKE